MGLDSAFASANTSPMVNYQERLSRTFGALGDQTRRAILARLERHGGVSYEFTP
jgi:hypothetical protein